MLSISEACSGTTCGSNAVCEISDGSPTCVCQLGFDGPNPDTEGCDSE